MSVIEINSKRKVKSVKRPRDLELVGSSERKECVVHGVSFQNKKYRCNWDGKKSPKQKSTEATWQSHSQEFCVKLDANLRASQSHEFALAFDIRVGDQRSLGKG
jgi:hypothetical protein